MEKPSHLKVVETLYENNIRDIPAMLRSLADEIEKANDDDNPDPGKYGYVTQVACVCHGERLNVFGWGDGMDGGSASLLLQTGNAKLLQAVFDNYEE